VRTTTYEYNEARDSGVVGGRGRNAVGWVYALLEVPSEYSVVRVNTVGVKAGTTTVTSHATDERTPEVWHPVEATSNV